MSILVVDIGGTYVKYAYMTPEGEMLSKSRFPTPYESRKKLIEEIGKLYDEGGGVEGIGVSIPGVIDSENGYCCSGGALEYNKGSYFAKELMERCPVPVRLENDAKCAVIAEAEMGSLKGAKSGFVLIFGTGIGGGLVIDGKLVKGSHFAAGEVSYIVTEKDALPGQGSLWADVCGVPALRRLYAEKKGLDADKVDGELVFEAVNSGDKDAEESLTQIARWIAIQIFNIQAILDPEKFAIGGGVSAQPAFINTIKTAIEHIYGQPRISIHKPEVVCCKFQNDANLYGAFRALRAVMGR